MKINRLSLAFVCREALHRFRSPRVVDTLKLELIDFRPPCHQCPYAAANYI